ncbi:hypothetical protein DBB36_07745 [Flavobacterium sp. WLB]|uniref:Uncharacterized protein n=1 Tax=Flavobacterium panici TaxID=2654843 RepID=A0A9N8IYV8_9FLAO|nr:hypothetical protein AKO67_18000 [Flavobacterium sp. VMW]OWU91053.1 hypothetical protein APR43_08830 [Flavobacterium sp. NLM]PUU70617.1 hypothetical protein DBB36_07745 [Flavobacterium sp. WLB]CAC9972344.1 hypothetical protein FLAPXU55_00020 [Flavobacterium panici]
MQADEIGYQILEKKYRSVINKSIIILKISQLNQDITIFYFSFLNFAYHNKKYRFEKHFI